MLQSEFENRVKMTVSASEFDAINVVYMQSDLNKDDFCKEWAKMNKSRIQKAQAEKAEREQRESDREQAEKLFYKLNTMDCSRLAVAVVSVKEEDFMKRIGIPMMEYSSYYGMEMFRQVLSVSYDLGKFAGLIR